MGAGPGTATGAGPRSLADDLRARDDASLAALLRDRPDLLTPVPHDLGQLAVRAGTAASVARALDRLDRLHLQVVEVLAVLPDPASAVDVRRMLPGVDDVVDRALRRLWSLALLWGEVGALHLVRAARDLAGSSPAELGPPLAVALAAAPRGRVAGLAEDLGLGPVAPDRALAAVEERARDVEALTATLAEAPEPAREVLERLTWGPPVGRVEHADRDVRTATAASPVEWLLARGLLVAVGSDAVALPREVGLLLRGGRVHRHAEPTPPAPDTTATRSAETVDRTAADRAWRLVRSLEDLLETWAVDAPSVLRSGGLGVRDLRAAATLLDADEATVALLVEVAQAVGLLTRSGDVDEAWLPTTTYDVWRAQTVERRWSELAGAWLALRRLPGLVGERDERDKPLAALGPGLDSLAAPALRRAVLADLADLPPGTTASAASLAARQAWRRPRQTGRRGDQLVAWCLREAELLGMTGLGALASYARPLLGSEPDPALAAAELLPRLPAPVDHVLLQADLTAVAPGPLDGDLARELALLADVESTGGATVYRFTDRSLRRALDAGRAAVEVHAFLARHSRTPVPQPLTYLVDDVARRHGRVRAGAASAYLRCDDPAVLDEVVADRRSDLLRLRRLAPTVVTSQVAPDLLLARLREMGLSPVLEAADGAVLARRPDSRRGPARDRGIPPSPDRLAPDEAVAVAAVRALRAGDVAPHERTGQVGGPAGTARDGHGLRTATSETLAVLRTAVTEQRPVWLGYVDEHGATVERRVDPVQVAGGRLTAFDHRYGEVRSFAVHRITGVALLSERESPSR